VLSSPRLTCDLSTVPEWLVPTLLLLFSSLARLTGRVTYEPMMLCRALGSRTTNIAKAHLRGVVLIVIDSGLSVRARPFFCSVTFPSSILFSHSRAIISQKQKLPLCTSPTLFLDWGGGDPAPQRRRGWEFQVQIMVLWATIDGDSLFVVFRLLFEIFRFVL